jgi:hypothetical protein
MIRRVVNLTSNLKCYNFLNTTLPILFERENSNFIHNYERLKYFRPSFKTFEGNMICGGTCYLLEYYLKCYGIKTKLMKSTKGYGINLEDHCFLLYNDELIIDPTFKQMFIKKNLGIGNDNYYDYLFDKLPAIFVGNRDDINYIYNKLNLLHKIEYNKKLENKLFFWDNYNNTTTKLDLDIVIKHKKYAIDKGRMFLNLYLKKDEFTLS